MPLSLFLFGGNNMKILLTTILLMILKVGREEKIYYKAQELMEGKDTLWQRQ